MKSIITILMTLCLSIMTMTGENLTDNTEEFPYSNLVEKYVATADFDKQKDIVIATRILSKFSEYPYLIFGAFSQENLPYLDKEPLELTHNTNGIRIIETYDTEHIRDVFSQLLLKFDPIWQTKINVTEYKFWIFIEINDDRIVLMDTNTIMKY